MGWLRRLLQSLRLPQRRRRRYHIRACDMCGRSIAHTSADRPLRHICRGQA